IDLMKCLQELVPEQSSIPLCLQVVSGKEHLPSFQKNPYVRAIILRPRAQPRLVITAWLGGLDRELGRDISVDISYLNLNDRRMSGLKRVERRSHGIMYRWLQM